MSMIHNEDTKMKMFLSDEESETLNYLKREESELEESYIKNIQAGRRGIFQRLFQALIREQVIEDKRITWLTGKKNMGFILYLIIGGVIGWLAGLILGKDVPGGIIGNIIAGIIGAWIGGMLFSFGPAVAGIQIIPALIGAIILIFIVSFIMKALRK